MIANTSFRSQRAPGTLGRDLDPVYGTVSRSFDINPYSYALNTSRALDPNTIYRRSYADFNILNELNNNYMDVGVMDTRIQGKLTWKPIAGLELSALGAVRDVVNSSEHEITDNSNQAMAYRAMPTTIIRDNNPYLYKNPDDPYAIPITVLPEGGIYERDDRKMWTYDFRAQATYNKVFNNKHIINAMAGIESNSTDRRQTWFRGWGMQYNLGEIPFYAYQVFKKGQEENTKYYTLNNTSTRSAAYMGTATYSYNRIYSLNGTIRYEGSNKLGKATKARWIPNWNVGGAWNVHEEGFFKTWEPALSTLTLRASYGLTSTRGPEYVTNSLAVINSYNPWRVSADVGESGMQVVSLENSDLTYEKKKELNVGMDIGFLNNRINTVLEYYSRNNYDLIGVIFTQGVGGENTKYGNVAAMKTGGFELTLSTKNIQTKDFSWTTDFIYSHLHSKVTQLISRKRMIDLVTGDGFAMQGYQYNSLFSIKFAGLTEEGYPQVINEQGKKTSTSIYFQERDSLQYLVNSGTTDPTYIGSFGNIFTYKNFRLNVFMTYSFGNVVRLDPIFKYSYNELTAMPKEFNNRWVTPGDELITNVPAIPSTRQAHNNSGLGYGYNAYNYTDVRIAKGDFIRLKEVSLTYDFSKKLVAALRMSNLSLKLQATNLLLLYADKKLNGQDPEFFNSGGVASPVPRQFTLTLRFGL